MELLTVIFRSKEVKTAGRTIRREAVRGIDLRGHELLMIYSPVNGDYKFPGGGVGAGETHAEALAREIREECGAACVCIDHGLGKVIEYDFAEEAEFDTFCMTSYYYFCQVEDSFGVQALDNYERDLGFRPVWVDIDEALVTNRTALQSQTKDFPTWTARETWVLEHIKQQFDL
jgi:8-oxo-dGTP diphosphatase